MRSYILYSFLIATVMVLYSCVHAHHEDKNGKHDHEGESKEHEHAQDAMDAHEEHSDEVQLTRQQMEATGIQFGEIGDLKINDFVKANGMLGIPPDGQAAIAAKATGILSGIRKYVEGDYIKKGAFIGNIENPDFIDLQKDYLEIKAKIKYTQQELERQRLLLSENAGIEKNVQRLEAEYAAQLIQQKAAAQHLAYLGLNTEQLNSSTISSKIPLHCSSSGYVKMNAMRNGAYVDAQTVLMEVIDKSHLHLELDVFEKDISKIKIGQKISYTVPAMGTKNYNGEVSVIAKELDPQTKTIRVHGHLDGDKPDFYNNLFINAKIWLNDGVASALPSDAIVMDEGAYFLYAGVNDPNADKTNFNRVMLIPGAESNGYTAIKLIDTIPHDMQVVTHGAFYIYAKAKEGALSHDH